MNRKLISILLVIVMIIGLFPMAVLADEIDDANEADANTADVIVADATAAEETVTETDYAESPYTSGPKGDRDVAVMVYGKSIADAVYKTNYGFKDFVNALKSELQGVLANEKLPDVELYLVNDQGQEYKLTKNAVKDAAFLSSFQYHASGILGWTEYVFDFVKDVFGWLVSGIDTIGEFYKIYGVNDIPGGDYTLEVREIKGEGYTLYQPESGSTRVHVGNSHVNYVGYDQSLGDYTFNISIDLWLFEIDVDVFTVRFSMPGVFMDTAEPGFSFRSADMGGNALPGTEFLLVNRDEVEKIVKASIAMGKDTFTNAMNLIGTEGFTWEELSVLNKDLLVWDKDAQQISFNDQEAYKLLCTYWGLVEASAIMPLTDFLSDDTDIRLPAILKATADENGTVSFTEDSNVTLVWSLKILMKLGNVVLTEAEDIELLDGVFKNPETEAIVNLVLAVAKFATEHGGQYWDENGEFVDGFVNDWIYPILQNDNVMEYAKDILKWATGGNLSEAEQNILNLLPTHAILTPKMPGGHYIMLETRTPDGFIHSPLYYTINMVWNTESQDVRDWCYVTVGNIGIVLPYYAEEYYTYLREFDLAKSADEVISKITDGKIDSIIKDTLSGNTDVTAVTIAYQSHIIYTYMGGNKVYGSELELAQALTKYLYAYGRTAQNLMQFTDKVIKEAKGVITSEITENWTFYNYSTSLRTNIALSVQAVMNGIAESIDTTGNNKITGTVKGIVEAVANNIDTNNHISDQTTALKNKVGNTVKTVAADIGKAALGAGMQVGKAFLQWIAKVS